MSICASAAFTARSWLTQGTSPVPFAPAERTGSAPASVTRMARTNERGIPGLPALMRALLSWMEELRQGGCHTAAPEKQLLGRRRLAVRQPAAEFSAASSVAGGVR